MLLKNFLAHKRSIIFGYLLLISAGIYSCQSPVDPQSLVLNKLFTDHMVLQQQADAAIWGSYTPGQTITVSASWDAQATSVADQAGNWSLALATPEAGGPYEVTISTADTSLIIRDVLIGEVWLASGQSNMEMPLTGFLPNEPIDNYQQEIAAADYPHIRMFTVARNFSAVAVDSMQGNWEVCSPATAADFSATAYFFARKLNQELQVPIGILHSSWGGTEAEAWTSKHSLHQFPQFINEIEAFDESQVKQWVNQFESRARPNDLVELEAFDMDDATIVDPGYDDGDWLKINLPHNGCRSPDFIAGSEHEGGLNGVFWYRTSFEVSDLSSDYQLVIGAIDDAEVTYINGQKVGATLGWQTKRIYTVPASLLKQGQNTIAIKHYDSGGGSAVLGPLQLSNQSGTQIDLSGTWSGLFYGDLSGRDIVVYGLDHQDKLRARPKSIFVGPNELASSLFNGMINPLVPYTIQGSIWYQGESNVGRAEQYERLFPAMIEDWRKAWDYSFSFYFVQIAPFSYGNQLSPALRDAQRKSVNTPKTGMAITMDIGDSLSIHPGNKQDVGHRLAFLALAHDYNYDLVKSGPLYSGHQVEAQFMDIKFDFVGSGLKAEGVLTGFEIATADGEFVPAKASIMGDKVRLYADQIAEPARARYGWSDYLVPSLFNNEGLPASSFTTD